MANNNVIQTYNINNKKEFTSIRTFVLWTLLFRLCRRERNHNKGTESTVKSESKDDDGKVEKLANALSRFSIGGYGEAVTSRNFYSQHFNRYRDPATYKNDDSHGRFDLPHPLYARISTAPCGSYFCGQLLPWQPHATSCSANCTKPPLYSSSTPHSW